MVVKRMLEFGIPPPLDLLWASVGGQACVPKPAPAPLGDLI